MRERQCREGPRVLPTPLHSSVACSPPQHAAAAYHQRPPLTTTTCVRVLHKLDAVCDQVKHVVVLVLVVHLCGTGGKKRKEKASLGQKAELRERSGRGGGVGGWGGGEAIRAHRPAFQRILALLPPHTNPPTHAAPQPAIRTSHPRTFMRRVALPSSTSPRRMSSNSFRLSSIGRSRQGLASRRSR